MQLAERDQAEGLAKATANAPFFSPLDFTISGIIMNNLVDTDIIVNEISVSQILQQLHVVKKKFFIIFKLVSGKFHKNLQ